LDLLCEGSPQLLESEGSFKDGAPSVFSDPSKFNEENSPMSSITEVTQGGNGSDYKIPMVSFASLVHDNYMVYNVILLLKSTLHLFVRYSLEGHEVTGIFFPIFCPNIS